MLGIVFSFFTNRFSKWLKGGIIGFTGGIFLAFICFEILPVAFMSWGLYYSIVGIMIGVVFCVIIENYLESSKFNSENKYNYGMAKTGILIGIGVMLHNIPEGIALGSLLKYNYDLGMKLAVLIALHCFPEACAICIPLRKSGVSNYNLILYGLLFAIPMGIGTLLGGLCSQISPTFVAFCLSFAGGVMLYISCGEIIPSSRNIWDSKFNTVVSCIGFLMGIVIINYL